jgi:polyhydroxyalkanoate synthase
MLRFGTDNGRAPVIFIPSLINPPRVLDISVDRSMLRHMAAAGHDACLIDWGTPPAADKLFDLEGHVVDRLLPMLAALPRPPVLVGYCLGGTLALGAAAAADVRAIATIATPWDFDGFPKGDRDHIASLWRGAKPTCQRLGYVPMEVLQSGFWSLDPDRTVRKYAAFADMADGSPQQHAFLAIEDWANEGPPLTFAAARQLFEQFYAGNDTGEGRWRVGGKAVAPATLACPTLSIRSSTDRIVPAAAAPGLKDSRTLAIGHVGMIVGSGARASVWNPLSNWLSRVGG